VCPAGRLERMSFQLMSFQALRKFTPSGCWSASCVGL
jgi:hypothetical protein